MSFEHMPGATVTVVNNNHQPLGEVVIQHYLRNERAYRVWWVYEQTGERESVKIPEWRLVKTPTQRIILKK